MANSWAAFLGPGGKAVVDKVLKRPNLNPYGTLNPEQIGVTKSLGGRLLNQIDQGPTQYGGQLSEGMTPEEQANFSNFNRSAAISGGTLDRLSNYDDASFNSNFDEEMTQPSIDAFRRYSQPLIEESLPTFSTARANAVGRGLSDLNNNLLTQRFSARESAKDRALRAVGAGTDFYSESAKLNAMPREIKQAGLDRQYQEFIRSNEQYQTGLNTALNFLGISTVAQEPDSMGRLIALIQAGAQIAGGAAKGAA